MHGLFFAILGWSAGRCCRLLRLHLAPFQHREGFRVSKTRPPLFRVLSSLDSRKILTWRKIWARQELNLGNSRATQELYH